MLQIWLLCDYYFLACAYIVAKPYVDYLFFTRHTITKFAAFVHVVCGTYYVYKTCIK